MLTLNQIASEHEQYESMIVITSSLYIPFHVNKLSTIIVESFRFNYCDSQTNLLTVYVSDNIINVNFIQKKKQISKNS